MLVDVLLQVVHDAEYACPWSPRGAYVPMIRPSSVGMPIVRRFQRSTDCSPTTVYEPEAEYVEVEIKYRAHTVHSAHTGLTFTASRLICSL